MNNPPENDEMRPHYDFSDGDRRKHHSAYRQGTNLVLLEDVAEIQELRVGESCVENADGLAGTEIKRNLA